jgi:hypothetical protein
MAGTEQEGSRKGEAAAAHQAKLNHLLPSFRPNLPAAARSIGPTKNAVPTKKNPTAIRGKASEAGEWSVLLRMHKPPGEEEAERQNSGNLQ